MMRWMRGGLALVTSIALCGCSFVFVHGPKPPPAPPSDCTSSRVVPILDAAAAGLFAVYGVYAALPGVLLNVIVAAAISVALRYAGHAPAQDLTAHAENF